MMEHGYRLEERPLTLQELGNALLNGGHAAAGTVGADGANMLEQRLCAGNDVGLVAQAVDEDILLLEKLGVLQQAEDLAEEGDGLLVELLRVANVGVDDLAERQRGVAVGQCSLVLLRPDGKLAAHSVLGRPHAGVDRVDCQSGHG